MSRPDAAGESGCPPSLEISDLPDPRTVDLQTRTVESTPDRRCCVTYEMPGVSRVTYLLCNQHYLDPTDLV
jgi:hypothetical protein